MPTTALQTQLDALFARRRGQSARTLDGVKAALTALPFSTHPWCQAQPREPQGPRPKAPRAPSVQSVQIVGTNGKGSTAAMLARVCEAAGLRTGLFTSPHLHHFRERYQIDGHHPSDPTLGRWLAHITPLATTHELAFFDIAMLLAVCLFAEAEVDVGIFEAGIGGRLDATSALPTTLTILTSVGLDHQQWLGPDHSTIAADKAAAFRVRAISGVTQPALQAEIAAQAKAQGVAQLWQWGDESDLSYTYDPKRGLEIALHPSGGLAPVDAAPGHSAQEHFGPHIIQGLQPSLRGDFQHHNAALAAAGFGMLSWLRMPTQATHTPQTNVSQSTPKRAAWQATWEAAVRKGLAETSWPGRLQEVFVGKGAQRVYLDGAHNPDAIEALRRNLPHAPFRLVFGAAQDKDIAACLGPLLPGCVGLYFCRFAQPRAADEAQLLGALARCPHETLPGAKMYPGVTEAMQAALDDAQGHAHEFILITGSLFVVAEALCALQPEKKGPNNKAL